ncbi:MAG: 3-methyl-2-oxobutanoate hydroxymethyltransferase [Fimbriimonadaceae bacterium]|nr:3-methyl-2-oxobutanoate hydroxymethyltransferase [Fimbriimonadaceae bacterium]
MKGDRPIVCLTAYDFPSGQWADAAGVDLILVGDSLGNVVQGQSTTIPVTVEEMAYHTRIVARAVRQALLVTDMPFGSFQSGVNAAVENAVTLMKGGAEAVKLEGPYADEIRAMCKAGIPVMGHVGMTPQSYHQFGGFKVQGREVEEGERVLDEARQIADAGAFAIVLELIPIDLARFITDTLDIPTIGIGAGPHCDGQIQVLHDVLGLSEGMFRHAKRYIEGRELLGKAIEEYAEDVRAARFPTREHGF